MQPIEKPAELRDHMTTSLGFHLTGAALLFWATSPVPNHLIDTFKSNCIKVSILVVFDQAVRLSALGIAPRRDTVGGIIMKSIFQPSNILAHCHVKAAWVTFDQVIL